MKPIIPIIVLTLISAATTASGQILAQGITPEGLTASTDTASADSPAQQAQAKALTLRECMEYAVSNSTQVRIQQSKNDDARLDRRDAILEAFTPSAEGNSYGYYRWGRSIDPETNTYLTTTSFNQGFSVSAGFTIFNGFSAINNMKIARTSMSMGISKEQQERDNVCLATIEAYFNVIYYTKLAEILTEQVENARNAVKLAERQEELGSKGYADVVQMKADLADREYELTTATNNRDNAMITLEDVMYWPVDEKLTIDPELSSIQTGANSPAADDIIANAVRSMPSVLIAKGSMQSEYREMAIPSDTRTLRRVVHQLLHLPGTDRLQSHSVLGAVQEQRRRICAVVIEHTYIRQTSETHDIGQKTQCISAGKPRV